MSVLLVLALGGRGWGQWTEVLALCFLLFLALGERGWVALQCHLHVGRPALLFQQHLGGGAFCNSINGEADLCVH